MTTHLFFVIKSGGKTYDGKFACLEDDGTTHLPMMLQSLLKEIAEQHPEFTEGRKISIVAEMRSTL